MKKITIMMIAMMILLSCAPKANIDIGIILPTRDEPRWLQDEANFKEQIENAGFSAKILFSQGRSENEKINVENLIARGIRVLVICPHDSDAAASAADLAHLKGIKVIAYDRIITNTSSLDFYVTFDNMAVGAAQARYLIERASGDGNPLYLYAGATTDNNAFFFFAGAWETLQPYIANGKFVIKNSSEAIALSGKAQLTREEQSKIINQISTNWDFNTAKSLSEAHLTRATARDKGDVFILAPNDGTARAIVDTFNADPAITSYVITGQDAEKASLQYIRDGKQSMTVYKDTRKLVDAAIEVAVKFLNGETIQTNQQYHNGLVNVPAKLLDIIVIDKDNVRYFNN